MIVTATYELDSGLECGRIPVPPVHQFSPGTSAAFKQQHAEVGKGLEDSNKL